MRRWSVRAPWAFGILLWVAGSASARPLVLSPVGVPVPGQAPVALTIAETGRGTYVAVGDYEGDQVRTHRLDKSTGTLSPVGAVPLPSKPSALASAHKGTFLLATTEGGDDVTAFRLDPRTGLLAPVAGSSVPSGGLDPVNLDVDKRGFAVVANKASSTLGVVRIDKKTGTLSPVGAPLPVGAGPNDVKVKGRHVVVGTAVSNEVQLLRLDRHGALHPVDARPVGASEVSGVAIKGSLVVASTFAGELHAFQIGARSLKPLGAHPTGSDVTDVAFAANGSLFVAGGLPGRLASFSFHKKRGLGDASTLPLTALVSRTLATVKGKKGTTFVIANEFQGDRTIVVSAERPR